MTISYTWLLDYLPRPLAPEKIYQILNSIGLEVEKMEKYEEVKGGLEGLLIGQVLECGKHPNADKLSLTRVDVGAAEPLRIVCGAPNVAAGQKVLVAPVGATIYPVSGDPLTMRVARIRGEESHGMICAEDEVGLGESHAGIMVLDPSAVPGTAAKDFFRPHTDWIFEIGLTPNRSDAMSHLGVARDICAWLTRHEEAAAVRYPNWQPALKTGENRLPISVSIEDAAACPRYSGITIAGVTVGPSPLWLVQRLKSIGLRPISNIVDITNFILHEAGQPLHAFDADRIGGGAVIVKKLPSGTPFVTLDEKERKLHADDLIICNGHSEPMCIAGVFGGLHSGVSNGTTNIFLESAFFEPGTIRRTSFRHNLRTDAAVQFEKSVDISNTANVLKRAAAMITEIAGGSIASDLVDIYPVPAQPKKVAATYQYLKKISGKDYAPETVKVVLTSLGFSVAAEDAEGLTLNVPLHKTDVSVPADIAEEVMRIDGFDNIEIPASIRITPSTEQNYLPPVLREKISGMLVGMGFCEIMNNSITNSAYLTEDEERHAVKMMNNLSAELDSLRVSMLETGLQTVVHNLNRRNLDLRLFEFGKTYAFHGKGQYEEHEHLALFVTGKTRDDGWQAKKEPSDVYFMKGIAGALLQQLGLPACSFVPAPHSRLEEHLEVRVDGQLLGHVGKVSRNLAARFDVKQDVYVADLLWEPMIEKLSGQSLRYTEIPKFPAVQRDLAFVVDRGLPYARVQEAVGRAGVKRLKQTRLFDVFESEKLGAGKKSMALSFTFLDEEKTLTDKDIDEMMNKIIVTFEKELNAEIRKA